MPAELALRLATPASRMTRKLGLVGESVVLWSRVRWRRAWAGSATDRLDLMRGVRLPEPDEGWDWPIAPFREVARDRGIIHRVRVLREFR